MPCLWSAILRALFCAFRCKSKIVDVYTCGLFINDGMLHIGYGVWIGERLVQSVGTVGYANCISMNHRSELFAVLALMILMCHRDERYVRIHVDSRYVKFVLDKYCFGSLGRFLSPAKVKNADILRLIAEMRRYDPERQVAVFHAPLSTHIAPVPPEKLFAHRSCPPFTTPDQQDVTPVSLAAWMTDRSRDSCRCITSAATFTTATSASSGSSSAISSRTAT